MHGTMNLQNKKLWAMCNLQIIFRALHQTHFCVLEYMLLISKTTLKPIRTYGIPLRGAASNSNIEILQRYQNKALRPTTNALRFISNRVLQTDWKVPTVWEGKASNPITALDRPWGFQEVEAPRFWDNRQVKVARFQPYIPAAFTLMKYSWYSFLLEAESTPGP
jgi:hypothetical protein